MSTDEAVDALEGALRSAYDVLGRRPETVSTLTDDKRLFQRIQHLESQLEFYQSQLEERDEALRRALRDLDTAQTLASQAEDATTRATERLALSKTRWEEERIELEKRIDDGLSNLESSKVLCGKLYEEIDRIREAQQESEKLSNILQSSLASKEEQLSQCEANQSTVMADCIALRGENVLLESKLSRWRAHTTHVVHAIGARETRWRGLLAFQVNCSANLQAKSTAAHSRIRTELVNRDRDVAHLSALLQTSESHCSGLQSLVNAEALRRHESLPVGCQTDLGVSVGVQTMPTRISRGGLTSSSSNANIDEIAKLRWELSRMRQATQFESTIGEREIAATMLYVDEQMNHLTHRCGEARRERDEAKSAYRKLQGEHAVVHRLMRELEETLSDRCTDILDLRGEISGLREELAAERRTTESLTADLKGREKKLIRRTRAHESDVGRLQAQLYCSQILCRWMAAAFSGLITHRDRLAYQYQRATAQRDAILHIGVRNAKVSSSAALTAQSYFRWKVAASSIAQQRKVEAAVGISSRQCERIRLRAAFSTWRVRAVSVAGLAQRCRDDGAVALQLGRLLASHEEDIQSCGTVLRAHLNRLLMQVDVTSQQLHLVRTKCDEAMTRNEELEQQLADAGRANAWLSDESKALRQQLRSVV